MAERLELPAKESENKFLVILGGCVLRMLGLCGNLSLHGVLFPLVVPDLVTYAEEFLGA